MVAVLHKELEYSGKPQVLRQVQEVEGHAAEDHKTSPNFQLVNKPS